LLTCYHLTKDSELYTLANTKHPILLRGSHKCSMSDYTFNCIPTREYFVPYGMHLGVLWKRWYDGYRERVDGYGDYCGHEWFEYYELCWMEYSQEDRDVMIMGCEITIDNSITYYKPKRLIRRIDLFDWFKSE